MNFIAEEDPEVWAAVAAEMERQEEGLEMIASENYTSPAVMQAVGSVLTNKYAEGYPGRRYYGGCEYVDVVENLARDRAKQLFGAEHVNVQPHSGSQANLAVYLTAVQPGDTVLGLDLAHGGHLTHGMKLNISGKLYHFVSYGVTRDTHRIDFDQVAAPGPRAQAEADRGRRQRLPARDSARQVRRDRPRGRGQAVRRHGPLRRPGGGRPARQPGAGGRLRHHHHAQDAARPARRHVDVQGRVCQGHRPLGVPRHPGRAADARHRRQGGLLRRSAAARTSSATPRRSSTTPRPWPRRCCPAACGWSAAAPTTT